MGTWPGHHVGSPAGEKADRAAWDRRMGQHQETTEPVRPEGYETEEKSVGSDARLPAPGQRRPGAPSPFSFGDTASLQQTPSSPVPTQARCCHVQSKVLIRTNHFFKKSEMESPTKEKWTKDMNKPFIKEHSQLMNA